MSGVTESYNAQGLIQYINEFDECVEEIKKAIKEVDDEINKTIQVMDANCGLYGCTGKKLEDLWINNSNSYENIGPLLEVWSSQLKEICKLNSETAAEVVSTYSETM